MSGSKGSPHRRYPKRSSRNSRSSERLKYKGLREFVLPSKADILENLVPEGTPTKNYKHLRPRKLINNLVQERNRYNNPDGIELFDDDTLADFLADSDEEAAAARPRKRGRKSKSSGSEWEESNDDEYSEGSAVSESDDVLEDDPRTDNSSNSDEDDEDPPVAVLSSNENESGDEGSDAQSVSSTEEFLAKRTKKSLRKLPKKVTASTWWKTNKGPLSASAKKRRPASRSSMMDLTDSTDSSSSSSSPVKQRQRRRMTISDEEDDDDERPSCSKVSNESHSVKKRTPICVEESEGDQDSPIKSCRKVRRRSGANKSKSNRTSILEKEEEDVSDNIEDDEDSPVVRNRRCRTTPQTAKTPNPVDSSEESDKSDKGKGTKAKNSNRKRIRTSTLLSSEESDNELSKSSKGAKRGPITHKGSASSSSERESSRSKNFCRNKSYGLDDDDDVGHVRRKTQSRSAKRKRSYFIDEEDENEDEILALMCQDYEEINTTDDLGNNARDSKSDESTNMLSSDALTPVKSDNGLPSCQVSSEHEKDLETNTIEVSGSTLGSCDQQRSDDRTVSDDKSLGNLESHVEQNAMIGNTATESKDVSGTQEGSSGTSTKELGCTTVETGVSMDNNSKGMAECETVLNTNDCIETEMDQVKDQTSSSDKDVTSGLIPRDSNSSDKDVTSVPRDSNVLLAEVLDGIVSLEDDEDDNVHDIANEIGESIKDSALADTNMDVRLDAASNDTNKNITSATAENDASVTSDTTSKDTNNDNATAKVATDANNLVKTDPETKADDYESDDSCVECEVPPKTPPIEITLSSDDETDLVPPPPVNTSNTATPVVGQSHSFPMAYNSSGISSGGFSYSGNLFEQHQQQSGGGFTFGASNAGSNPTNVGTAATQQRLANQTANNTPNYPTANQFGNLTQSMYNATAVRPVFSATSAAGGIPQFQQHGQQQVSRGWHQNSQNYQTGNRLPTGHSAQYGHSFTNARSMNNVSLSGNVAAPSDLQTQQSLVRNKPGAQQSASVDNTQHQYDLMSRIATGSNNAQIPRGLAQSQALLRNLLKTDTTLRSHMMRGNSACPQQFPAPNHPQTSSSKSVAETSSQNLQGRVAFQSSRNYIQPSTISNTDAVQQNPAAGVLQNYQSNPFATSADTTRQQQTIQNLSDGNGTLPRNYIHPSSMSNQRIVQATTAKIPIGSSHYKRVGQATSTARVPNYQSNPFGMPANTNMQQPSKSSSLGNANNGTTARAASSNIQVVNRTQVVRNAAAQYQQQTMQSIGRTAARALSQPLDSMYPFLNRPQRSGNPSQTDPNVRGTHSISTSIVAQGPISQQAVNSFQMRGSNLKQHNFSAESNAASGMTAGINYQTLQRVALSTSGRTSSSINVQSMNQFQMGNSMRQSQSMPSVNPSPAGSVIDGTRLQTPVSRLQPGSNRNTSTLGQASHGQHGLHNLTTFTNSIHRQPTPSATNTASTISSSSSTLPINRVQQPINRAQQPGESIQMQRIRNASYLLNSLSPSRSSVHKQNAPLVTGTVASPQNLWQIIHDNDVKPLTSGQRVASQLAPSASSVKSTPNAVSVTPSSDGAMVFDVQARNNNNTMGNDRTSAAHSQLHVTRAPERPSVRTNGFAYSTLQRASSQPDVCSEPMLARHPSSNVNPVYNNRQRGTPGGTQTTFLNRPKSKRKPVVILRDILSQIKSVNFGGAGEATRQLHIKPGKKFLIKENGNGGGQDIIPLSSPPRNNARLYPSGHAGVLPKPAGALTNGLNNQSSSTLVSNRVEQSGIGIAHPPVISNIASTPNGNPSQVAGSAHGISNSNQRSDNNNDKTSSSNSNGQVEECMDRR